MITKLFTFQGRMGRRQYFKYLILSIIGYIVLIGLLLTIIDSQNAEVAGASFTNQMISIILFIAFALALISAYITLLSLVVRRARDVGQIALWVLMVLFIPGFMIILGFIPAKKR